MPSKGRGSGRVLFLEPIAIERSETFDAAFFAEQSRQLTWDTYAVSYDRVLLQLPFYEEVVTRHVDAMTAGEMRRVLDLGAGTGNVTLRVLKAGMRVVAIDLSRAMLDRLRWKLGGPAEGLTIVEQDCHQLRQWSNGSFDGVNILLALYDMARPVEVIAEAIRVLRPGGQLVVTEPKRCFNLQSLIDYVSEFLRERNLHAILWSDWQRVIQVNKVLDPTQREARLSAEDIELLLRSWGFDNVRTADSHLGNCATIWATKRSSSQDPM